MQRKHTRARLVRMLAGAGTLTLLATFDPALGTTTVSWVAPVDGAWNTAAHWSTGTSPNNGTPAGETYHAMLTATGAVHTVTLNANPTLDRFTIDSPDALFRHFASRTMTILDSVHVNAGTYELRGLMRTPVLTTGPQGRVTVPNLSIAELIDTENLGTVEVQSGNSLTFSGNWTNAGGTVELQDGSSVRFDGTFRFADIGFINRQSELTDVRVIGTLDNSNATLVLNQTTGDLAVGNLSNTRPGTGIVAGGRLQTSGTASLVVQGRSRLLDLENQGLIRVIDGTELERVTNNGTINATLTHSTIIATDLNNAGTINVFGDTLLVLSGAWQNTGTITITDATLKLSGNWSSNELSKIALMGNSTVQLSGSIDNVGKTITLTDGHTWTLLGGALNGGTIASSGASITLATSAPSAGLSGVTLAAHANVPNPGGVARISNGLIFAPGGLLTMQSGTRLELTGTQTLAGSGTVQLGAAEFVPQSGVVTIGPGVVVHDEGGATLGTVASGTGIINEGVLLSTQGNGSPTVVRGLFQNDGVVQAVSDASLRFEGSLSNSGDIDLGAGCALVAVQDFTQTDEGIAHFELGGTGAGEFARVQVLSSATMTGTLEITLLADFDPLIGDEFQLVTAGSLSAGGLQILIPSLGGDRTFTVEIDMDSITARVIPEPYAVCFLLFGPALLRLRNRVAPLENRINLPAPRTTVATSHGTRLPDEV